MGDPYGLISDEADFLSHTAKIVGGEGVRFYGNYRFLYTGVLDWDAEVTEVGFVMSVDLSGDEYRHNALIGASFPLGPGRMGLFFEYEGRRGGYDGDGAENGLSEEGFL